MTTDSTPNLLVTDLKERIAQRRVVALVGAGVALAATAGNPIAGWKGLLQDGIGRCRATVPGLSDAWAASVTQDLNSGDVDDLLSAAQKIENKLKRIGEFGRWMIDTVGQLPLHDSSVIDALAGLGIPIVTTNYDGLIEKTLGVTAVTWREHAKYERVLQGDREGVLHLHGFYEDEDSIVLGTSSYDEILRDQFAQSMQRAMRSMNSLLFVGYGKGLSDPNFAALLAWARTVFRDSPYRHYRLTLSKDVQDIQSEHNPADRIFALPYGSTHADLVPFLQSLALTTEHTNAPSVVRRKATAASMPAGTKPRSQFQDYLSAVRVTHGQIKFVELPLYEDTPDIAIDELYVEPSLCRDHIVPDRPESDWPARFDLDSILAKFNRVVLLGDPGYGKSTLISCMSWRLCANDDAIPVPMVVRELQLKADLTWESLLDAFLQHRIGKLLGSRGTLESLLRGENAVVLLDGLDEIGSIIIRKRLRDAVHTGMSEYPNVKWILTSRVVGYDQVPFHTKPVEGTAVSSKKGITEDLKRNTIAAVFYLAPFSSNQIRDFATKWYKRHEADPALVSERSESFVQAINENAGTKRLARVAYLLTLMALIHRKAATLPYGRTDLYDRIATAYLESIDLRRELDQVPYSLSQKKRWLAEAGYQMQLRRTKKQRTSKVENAEILATEAEVCQWLAKAMSESGAEQPAEEAKVLLDYFAKRSGLLVPRGEGLFAFMHLSLQEYFAACYLEPRLTSSRFAKAQRASPTDNQLLEWTTQSEWLEVYVLLFELLAKKDASDTEEFFNFLFVENSGKDGIVQNRTSARLLAELVSDPFVVLSASTRKIGRQMCWRTEFDFKLDMEDGRRRLANESGIPQLLVAGFDSNIRAAWDAADLTAKVLKQAAIYLNLSGCTGISDIAALGQLTRLKVLLLSGCTKLEGLTPLSKLKALEQLSLARCNQVSDISPLGSLTKLVALNLSGPSEVKDFEVLSRLKLLRDLLLPEIDAFDSLRSMSELAALKTLSIDHLSVPVNFAHLQKCEALNELIIQEASAEQDLLPLAHHKSLVSVHFHDFPADIDLAPFVNSKTIRRICLGGKSPNSIPKELIKSGVIDSEGLRRTQQRRAKSVKST